MYYGLSLAGSVSEVSGRLGFVKAVVIPKCPYEDASAPMACLL